MTQVNQHHRIYAGIGSRTTPPEVLAYMRKAAQRLAARGFTLRSGAADGADSAFEQGCDEVGGAKEIWLPWKGFNRHADTGLYPGDAHFDLVSKFHPAWNRLGRGPRSLHARNVGQVLGHDCRQAVGFVLCWTPDGCEASSQRTQATGGTGTAIEIACAHNIPVFNLARPDARERFAEHVLGVLDRHPG